MLLKWQAVILNKIYQTTAFDKIVINSTKIETIDYLLPLDLYRHLMKLDQIKFPSKSIKINDFVDCVHTLCKSENMEEKKQNVLMCNKIVPELHQLEIDVEAKKQQNRAPFSIFHVILFSSLSKCTIWPAMFKTSKALVPSLVDFYNQFFNNFSQYLDYKFDPLILSTKYNKLVKQIKEKKLANPQLFDAVQNNNSEKIEEIVNNSPGNILNQCMKNGLYLSHFAAIHSNLKTLKLLHNLKINFELTDEEQQTALFYAVKRFDLDIIKFLVEEAKVEINHKEYQYRTPIYLAAFEGNLEIVEYLYSKGGDPNIESKLSRTPLSKACYLGNVKVAEYLIKLGVNMESIDSKGRTALHNAAWGIKGGRQGKRRGHIRLEDSPQCAQLLIKAGHKIDFEDFDKFTPLFSAVSSHAERSLRVLIKYGANLSHKTIKNESAVFIACKYGHLKILKILIEQYECSFLEQTVQGYTPIMAALTQDDNECTFYMLSLFLKKKIEFQLDNKLLQCLIDFSKLKNIQFFIDWLYKEEQELKIEAKKEFLARSIEKNIEEILQFSISSHNQEKMSLTLTLLEKLQQSLSKKVISKLIQCIQKNQIYNDVVITMLLKEHKKGFSLPQIPISQVFSEELLIDLLQVDSNLTQSPLSVYNTLISLVRMRSTKVIISILNFIREEKEGQNHLRGIRKFGRKELFSMIYGKMQGSISVFDYSLVNNYFDMYKILHSFSDQTNTIVEISDIERPSIPCYDYQIIQLEQTQKSFLMPLKNIKEMLNFQYFSKQYLSPHELVLYSEVKKDLSKFKSSPLVVKSLPQLAQMKNHLENRQIIGIDVEHFSSKKQSFICLVQIATLQRVFLIDAFNSIYHQIEKFLQELFSTEKKIKIFHSYDNDLKWLCQNYQINAFQSILDTSRIYCLLQNQKSNTPSLKFLAQKFLKVNIKKEYQQSDWRIRPLFPQMADYAVTDAKVLPYLLLSMLETMPTQSKKGHCLQLIRYMQSKRMLKTTNKRHLIKLI